MERASLIGSLCPLIIGLGNNDVNDFCSYYFKGLSYIVKWLQSHFNRDLFSKISSFDLY